MAITLASDLWVGYLLAAVRIVSWLLVVPPFSSRSIPVTAKVVLSLGLAMAVGPALQDADLPEASYALVVAVVTQVAIGASMGLVTMLLLAAVSAAGSLIDVFGGFSLAFGFDPLAMQGGTVFGTFHQLLATTLLFATGLHMLVVGGVLRTFESLPIGASPDFGDAGGVVVAVASTFFAVALQIAMPVLAVLFIADLGLALLTKVAPQLNAINVMFPAKIGLTLLILGLSFPVLVPALERLVEHALQAMSAVIGFG